MKVNPHGYPAFFKTYIGETRHRERIHIPPAFVKEHIKELRQDPWVVKTEDGESWDMNIERKGTEHFFCKKDWEKFAEHYDLRFGDMLHFFLVGKSQFEVLLFSQTNSCRIILPLQHDNNVKNIASEDHEIVVKNVKKKPELQSEGVVNLRFSKFDLSAESPYFETIVKKSHKKFMSVPVRFARRMGMAENGKRILLVGENGKKEVEIGARYGGQSVYIRVGWRAFREANDIKDGDRCRFTIDHRLNRANELLHLSVVKLHNNGD